MPGLATFASVRRSDFRARLGSAGSGVPDPGRQIITASRDGPRSARLRQRRAACEDGEQSGILCELLVYSRSRELGVRWREFRI